MLYVVTAALNGLDRTQALVRALARTAANLPLRLVVVDNGSTDGTVQWLNGLQSNNGVQLIANERNVGAAGAWNQGIRFAVANQAPLILVCGNDTCPMPGTVERLAALVERGLPFVTGTQVSYDAPEAVTPSDTAGEPLLHAPDFSFFLFRPYPVTEQIGIWDLAVEFARRKAWEKDHNGETLSPFMNPWCYGLFDERYFPAYFEDGDYHWRAQNAGVPLLCDPGALFRHDCSMSIRINPDVGRLNQEQTFRVNAELFKAKWGGLPHELGIQSARPLNVTDEQWAQMTGGRPVVEVDRVTAIEQARRVYGQYGVTA